MKRLQLFKFVFLLILLSACTKENNLPPRDFGVGVENIRTNSVLIRWSESTDPENSIVKYRVLFAEKDSEDYTLVSDNISETQFPDRNREFFFFQSISNLKMDTEYKGKIVAFDQDGAETESTFFFRTLLDEYVPVIKEIKYTVYRYSANIYVDMDYDKNHVYMSDLKADIYLNDELMYEDLEPVYEFRDFIGEQLYFNIELEGLEENKNYETKVVVKGLNNSFIEEHTFSTISASYSGNVVFRYQEEVDEFSKNEFEKITGNVMIIVPESTCHPENHNNQCNYSITDLSGLNSIIEIDGNLHYGGAYDGLYGAGNPVSGLANLKRVAEDFTILGSDPSKLVPNLETIGGSLIIDRVYSDNFTELSFLSSLTFIGGNLIISNTGLHDFCGLKTALSGTFNGTYTVNGNTYNPTLQDILNGNCKQ